MNAILTQAEADHLLAMEKLRKDAVVRRYPDLGGSLAVPLVSTDGREAFLLDLSRGRAVLGRNKYQTRARRVVVLARLDIGGRPHKNPDDGRVPTPHLHLYREGYGDKWAFPVPRDAFRDLADPWRRFDDFMRFCNVIKPPLIERGLFT